MGKVCGLTNGDLTMPRLAFMKKKVERESSTTEVGKKTEKDSVDTRRKGRVVKEITEETHEKVEVVYKVPEKMDNKELKEKLTSIEAENKEMRKSLAQLSEHIRALTARVNLLEKESSDEGVDLSFQSPTGSAPFCPHYTDCKCLANRFYIIMVISFVFLSYAFTTL